MPTRRWQRDLDHQAQRDHQEQKQAAEDRRITDVLTKHTVKQSAWWAEYDRQRAAHTPEPTITMTLEYAVRANVVLLPHAAPGMRGTMDRDEMDAMRGALVAGVSPELFAAGVLAARARHAAFVRPMGVLEASS